MVKFPCVYIWEETGDIEKKLDVVHILNGILGLAKTRNLIFLKKKKKQFGFPVNQLTQSGAVKHLISKTT